MRNTIPKSYNAVSAPVAATRDALAARLQSIRETASFLYNRMMENMGYGRERLEDIVEKKQKKKPKSNSRKKKYQQQPRSNNRMMMSNMMRLKK